MKALWGFGVDGFGGRFVTVLVGMVVAAALLAMLRVGVVSRGSLTGFKKSGGVPEGLGWQ